MYQTLEIITKIVSATIWLALFAALIFLFERMLGPVEYDEEETDNKYAEFEDIETDKKAHTFDGFLEIVHIFNKYPGACVQPEHDEMFFHIEYEKEVSQEDAKRLYELGAFYEYDCWKLYISA